MYNLTRVEIDGFWGTKQINVDLHPDVNIFIGPNGTGKTTFINILQASLTLDLQLLNQYKFKTIRLILTTDNSKRTISIKKIENDTFYDTIEYQISREKYIIPLLPRDTDIRRRVSPRHIETINMLREKLSSIVETCWLSVHREILEEKDYEIQMRGRQIESVLNPIDSRLRRLIEKFQNYQIMLQSKANELSVRFQRTALMSLLYNHSYDTFDIQTESDINYSELKEQLTAAYNVLGVLNEHTVKSIENHIDKIQESIQKVGSQDESKSLTINDVLPLSLFKRTKHIVNQLTKNEENKRQIFKHINLFVETINGFLVDKQVELNIKEDGGLSILKNKDKIKLEALSSGEKQLFILLVETLLQDNRNAIFLADEPELSLHIAWQRSLLAGIRALNRSSQIIVATHSPEIAGKWVNNIIDMEEILK